MTTSLAIYQSKPVQLSEVDALFLEQGTATELAYKYQPIQLTVAAGGAKMFVSGDGESIPSPLTGIVIGAVISSGAWREGNKVPVCSSIGGKFGRFNPNLTQQDFEFWSRYSFQHAALPLLSHGSELPATFDCAACALNSWGSDIKGGRGKACAEKRRLLVVIDGWAGPAILNLPTMSIKAWDAYCSTLRIKNNKPYYAVVTEFAIEKIDNKDRGQSYGMVKPTMKGFITDRDMAMAVIAAQREFADILGDVTIEDINYESAPQANGAHSDDNDNPF